MTRYSVKKPLTIVVIMMAVVLLGVVSYTSMSTDLLPKMDLPYVVVMTTYPGATPEKVEATVTDPLEQGLATTSGLANMTSVSQENVSMIIMEFSQGINMDSVMIELSGKVDMVKPYLDDAVGTPTMMKINPDMMAVVVASADIEDMDFAQACTVITDKVIPALERVPGVASVSGSGLLEQSVQVIISQDKIDAINRKILRSVDSELAEAQDKMDEAQQQIYDGHNALNSQQKKLNEQKGQLEEGLSQLNSGLSQAREGLATLLEKKEEATEAAALLRPAVEEMRRQQAALEAKEELTEQEKVALEAIHTALPELEAQLSEVDAGLALIAEQEQTLTATVADLEGKQAEAQKGYEAITVDAVKQMQAVRNQLNAGQKELDAQREIFESSRDEALEKADISGLITADMITGILAAQNFSMPAGYLTGDGEDIAVKVGDVYGSLEELENQLIMNIPAGDVGYVYLKDVAEIQVVDNSEELYAKINGNDGVLLSIQKQSTAATTDVTHAVSAAMKELEGEIPGLRMVALQDQGVYIDTIIAVVLENLMWGGILAVIVLWIFLRSFRPTLIVALSIPLSLMLSVVLMYFSGVTLNIISLAGLMLSVGMLVDNSIVVIENIYRLRAQGVPAARAALQGAQQVGGAIVASTLTTVCVFLPIVFTEGLTRQIFTDMGLTIAYSLLSSLLVALTLVPALSSTMLRSVKDREHRIFDRFAHGYGTALGWVLRHKAICLLLAVGLLGTAGWLATSMGTAFMPESDSKQISISMSLPEGSEADIYEVSGQMIDAVMTVPEVDTVGAMTGDSSLLSMGGGDGISYYIILKEDRKRSSQEIASEIAQKTAHLEAELDISASTMDISMLGGSGITVVLEGDDMDTLRAMAADMAAMLEQIPGTDRISDGMEEAATELRVVVDKNRAMNSGVTVAQIYQQVAKVLSNQTDATTITLDGESTPIIVIQDKGINRINLQAHTWDVTGPDGTVKTLRLSDFARVEEAPGFTAISHNNQARTLKVSAAIAEGYNVGLVSREFEARLKDYEVPKGCHISLDGENEMINNTLRDLLGMIGIAVVLIYLIMVAQFQNWLSPFVVIFTIPLAFTGGLLALWLAKMEISMIAMLGFLMLSGVIVNNGIVFVDYTNQLREGGMERREALVETGRARLRPILMTTMTTVLGLITMAMGMGSGAEMLQPMAVTMIGGLLYATLMTLFVVPALYDLFQRRPPRVVDLEEK